MQQRMIEGLWQRDESVLPLLQQEYGAYCRSIAARVLDRPEDVEECMNDALLRVWQSIPPQRPQNLRLFFARIVRNLAFDAFRREHAQKRNSGEFVLLLDELAEALPDRSWPEAEDNFALRESLEGFLRTLSARSRRMFLRRYWYNRSIPELAQEFQCSEGSVKNCLFRCRRKLKAYLEQEEKRGRYHAGQTAQRTIISGVERRGG